MRISLIALTATVAATVGLVGFGERSDPDASFTGNVRPSSSLPSPKTGRDGQAHALPVQLAAGDVPPGGAMAQAPAPFSPAGQATPAAPSSAPLPVTPPAAAPPQAVQVAPQAPAASPVASATPAPVVDESALRYFASRGDTVRLQAEIARLRALYPQWTPPADPLQAAAGTDARLEQMWQLYGQGRYDEARQAIAGRQQSEPGWQPPRELLESLRLAETRAKIVTASDGGHFDEVVQLAAGAPALLTCSEVDMLWRVGEAFAKTDRKDRARDAYSYILANCHNGQERLATMQKASGVLDAAQLADLLKYEQTVAGGQPEFASIRDDIARQLVSKAGEDAALVVPKEWLDRVQALAAKTENASDALLLGWYYYRRDAIVPAEKWFGEAFTRNPEASSAQGLALAQIANNDPGNAENTAYRFRDSSDEAKSVYLAAAANLLALDPPQPIENTVLARMAPVVLEAHDTAAAEQFGWYARMLGQMQTAADWFRLALTWDSGHEPAAYGLAITLDALRDREGVLAIQRAWAGRSPRIEQLGEARNRTAQSQLPPQQPQVAQTERRPAAYYQPERREAAYYQEAVETAPQNATPQERIAAAQAPAPVNRTPTAGCRSHVNITALSAGSALTRGWCLMELNRPLEAVQAFDRALQAGTGKTREDAAYGKSLAYLRVGLTEKAAVAASAAPQHTPRAAELQTAILANRAIGAFRLGRYQETIIVLDQRSRIAPERQDLMVLRGLAYKNLGYRGEARRIFQALADTGNNAGIRALADLRAEDVGENRG